MRILLVEDTPKHASDAVNILTALGVDVMWRSNGVDAILAMQQEEDGVRMPPAVDGVITDIYIPEASNMQSKDPCGLGVALMAEQSKVPFVMCTAGSLYALGWIADIGRYRGWSIVGSSTDHHNEAPTKNWADAWKELEKLIRKSQESSSS